MGFPRHLNHVPKTTTKGAFFGSYGGVRNVFDEMPQRSYTSFAKRTHDDIGYRNKFYNPRLRPGFYRSAHSVADPQFVVVPNTREETPVSDSIRVSKDAEKICRILLTKTGSSVESSLDDSGVAVSPALVEETLKRLSNAGMLALAFFRWAEKRNGFMYTTDSFHYLIEALGKIKQFRLIWSLVDFMRLRGLVTKETFALVIRRYARARKIKEAIETFEKMGNFGLRPELSDYNRLIDTISKSKQVKRAQELFDEMKRRKKFMPNLKTYTILLEGWGQERNLTKLKKVYKEMIDEGFEPDVVTYGILINAFCKSEMCDEAIRIYNEMAASNCEPTPHIYCTLINGLGSEKRLGEALKYFELSKASGFTPEVPTYNAVVGSYCGAARFDDAFAVVNEMKRIGIGPNSRTYDIIIHHLIKAGKAEEAYRVFQTMEKDEGCCRPQLNTYTMMVTLFCSNERVDMALKMWKQMSEKGIVPCMHMFSSLINGLCYENRLDEACRYFQEMLDKGIRPPGQLFSKLKEALVDGSRKDLAIEMSLKLDRLRNNPLDD